MYRTLAIVGLFATLQGYCQILSPFTAAEGIRAVLRIAQQRGVNNPTITAIYTTGDTAVLSPLNSGPTTGISLAFDFQQGTNTVWVYAVQGKTSNQQDTVVMYATVKLWTLYQAFPLLGLPGFEQLRGEFALPTSFMNSDVMVRKLAANAAFQSFRARYPQMSLFGATLTNVRPRPSDEPFPIWSVWVGQGTLTSPAGPSLQCIIPAADTSGIAECVEIPFSATPDVRGTADWAIEPNPAIDVVTIHVPERELLFHATVEICSMRGEVLARYPLSTVAPTNAIAIPVSSLASGTYMLCYHHSNGTRVFPLLVIR
ncbi:MAG: T9SS type A sorting domain-containing protein [Bacteroidota bacterium]|nr:T9SS type A sorting domain-containing protein [Chlorobiota bacterium]MDW8074255.1 T9SS type A sorting domain-containing protein [Bacteroidota bacterium]